MQTLNLEIEGSLTRLIFSRSNKKLNILDALCMQEFEQVIDQLECEMPEVLLIQSYQLNCFVAGADLDVIASQHDSREAKALSERGQLLFRRIEQLSCHTIALVQGTCLGGGLELVLACDHVIAVDQSKTRLGLPEIQLGIHPGFGGCVRLPKRVGWPKAVEMILTGHTFSAKQAYRVGLVDLCCDVMDIKQAEQFLIQKEVTTSQSRTPFWFHAWPLRRMFFSQAKKRVLKKTKHVNDHAYPALKKTLRLLEELYGMSDGLAFARESESLGLLAVTPSCHHLIRVFKLGQALKHQSSLEEWCPIKHIAVYGAGVMGGGIAWLAAKKHQVDLHEINEESMRQGMLQLDHLAKRDDTRLTHIRPTMNDSGLKQVQMVIEAVSENMQLKQTLWCQVETQVSPDCLLLSNTSSLSISEMQEGLKYPKRMAGLHFFNPVHKMPLVEIIAGKQTDLHVVHRLCALMSEWGKYPIVVKDCPGFLVNRCLLPYIKAAVDALAQGQSVAHIDQCLKHFGMPMGAFELMDRIGLDICLHVGKQLNQTFPEWFEQMVERGVLGCKSERGFYVYQDNQSISVNTVEITKGDCNHHHLWSCHQVVDACLLPMLLEAWHCLDEQIVSEKDHLDAAMVYGIGFPPFHGGLLHYFEQQNQKDLWQRMSELSLDVTKFKP